MIRKHVHDMTCIFPSLALSAVCDTCYLFLSYHHLSLVWFFVLCVALTVLISLRFLFFFALLRVAHLVLASCLHLKEGLLV